MKRTVATAIVAIAVAGCGGTTTTKANHAKACGARVSASLTPGFGGQALRQQVGSAAAGYYMMTGICSADQ